MTTLCYIAFIYTQFIPLFIKYLSNLLLWHLSLHIVSELLKKKQH